MLGHNQSRGPIRAVYTAAPDSSSGSSGNRSSSAYGIRSTPLTHRASVSSKWSTNKMTDGVGTGVTQVLCGVVHIVWLDASIMQGTVESHVDSAEHTQKYCTFLPCPAFSLISCSVLHRSDGFGASQSFLFHA